MRIKLPLLVTFTVIVIVAGIIINKQWLKSTQKPVHYHAGFIFYENNKPLDFSDAKYMHIEPCGEDEHDDKDNQEETVHLHDNTGDVVHIHAAGVKWQELLEYLKLTTKQKVAAFSDGKIKDDILNEIIKPYESVVFFIGKNSDADKKAATPITKKHIETVEKKGENCGS